MGKKLIEEEESPKRNTNSTKKLCLQQHGFNNKEVVHLGKSLLKGIQTINAMFENDIYTKKGKYRVFHTYLSTRKCMFISIKCT